MTTPVGHLGIRLKSIWRFPAVCVHPTTPSSKALCSVYPLNPTASEVESQPAFASITELPVVPESLSIVTPPHVTRIVIQQTIVAGVRNGWMQPGAEDSQASQAARKAGLNVIDDGSCVLVLLAIEAKKPRS